MSQDPQRNRPVEVSRVELYRQVWQTPMSHLATQYGVSGNGLAKICKRLSVPYPPRGYWAKKAVGNNVGIDPLPPAGEKIPSTVTISPTPPPVKPPELHPEIRVRLETARAEATAIAVPERLQWPHPIVARWLDERDRRKLESRRERDPWRRKLIDPGELNGVDRRRYRVLDTLFKALDQQGGKAKEGDRGELWVEMQGERIEFRLREKQKQVRRPLNDDEKRWASRDDKGWRQELVPTGKFVFTIKTYLPGNLRGEWIETDDVTMESLLPDVVATIVAAYPLLVEQRRQHEEAERQRRIEERKRYEEEERRKLDNNRWRRFLEFAQRRRDAQLARAFLDELKMGNIDLQREIAGYTIEGWIAWAENRVADADPLNQGAYGVFEAIAKVKSWSYGD